MGFFTEHCPNCGKSISKQAEHCSECGCPSAKAWSTCQQCTASVGAESKFCWKCGTDQSANPQRKFYGDRWHRSPVDFAVKVALALPEKTLHHGLQVDEGTLALLFQDGRFIGDLGPGYHTFDTFLQRLAGFDKGKEAHAVLLDTGAAEVDFHIEDVRVAQQIPIDIRVRLLFRVVDSKLFADQFLTSASTFTTQDIASRFMPDVKQGLQRLLEDRPVDSVTFEIRVRELIEKDLLAYLTPILAPYGLEVTGVRLADFGGQAVDYMREKLGEIARLNRELEVTRRLNDAVRAGKAEAFRDEEQLKDTYERILHEFGLSSAGREEEKRHFVAAAEHRVQMEGLRLDYEARRAEILNRLDEQTLRHQSEIADARHGIEVNRLKFTEDLRQQQDRFDQGQTQQVSQAKTDLEIARQGIEALKLVKEAKLEARRQEDAHEMDLEAQRLQLRGASGYKALMATLTGEQADRVLKLAELEMRNGLSPEQALALVAEKSPEIAPAVAEALKAKYAQPPPSDK